MTLSKRDLKALAFYAAHRNRPPTIKEFVPKLALIFLIHVVLASAAYLLLADEMPALVWFFIGMLVGAFLRDVRRIVFTLQLWPFTASIIDWDKVAELVVREG
jgi:small-conductance mechanosensitive channel